MMRAGTRNREGGSLMDLNRSCCFNPMLWAGRDGPRHYQAADVRPNQFPLLMGSYGLPTGGQLTEPSGSTLRSWDSDFASSGCSSFTNPVSMCVPAARIRTRSDAC